VALYAWPVPASRKSWKEVRKNPLNLAAPWKGREESVGECGKGREESVGECRLDRNVVPHVVPDAEHVEPSVVVVVVGASLHIARG